MRCALDILLFTRKFKVVAYVCVYLPNADAWLEENRLIEMGLSGSSRAKTKFYHFEEKFMNHGETVVVWCLRDFCNNPRYDDSLNIVL